MPPTPSAPGSDAASPVGHLLRQAAQERAQGRFDAAAQACVQAINLAPQQAAPYVELMSLLLQIGDLDNAELVQGNIPAAVYQQTPQLRYAHGYLLTRRDRVGEAIAVLSPLAGVAGIPQGDLCNTIGTCHLRQDRFAEAEAWYARAAASGLRSSILYQNRAGNLANLGDIAGAERLFAEARALFPGDGVLLYEYATFLLKTERFEEGFRLYAHRWEKLGVEPPRMAVPRWDGVTPVHSLLVLGEQGVGDQIVHSALLPALMARVGKVTLAVDPRLAPLLGRAFPGLAFVDPERPPADEVVRRDFDAWIDSGDLGAIVPEGIGWQGGYLRADPARRDDLRARYQARFPGKRLVGISWKSQRALLGANKSCSLLTWAPVLRQPGIQFISLQYGDVDDDLAAVRRELGVDIFRDPDIDAFQDLDGLAAQAGACDLVITSSSSTAHVTAATHAPTWVLLPGGASLFWYWGLHGDRCRWYPEARLFRADPAGTWSPVLERVARNLEEYVQ